MIPATAVAAIGVRADAGLLFLFLYSIPCEFLVSLAPHEPAILYFATRRAPSVVALVAGSGTLAVEFVNYELLRRWSGCAAIAGVAGSRTMAWLSGWFGRAPFLTLWIAGFISVIPFSPLRLFVLLREYSRLKYLTASVTSRMVRFYLVALAGHVMRPSTLFIAIVFAALVITVTLPGVYALIARKGYRSGRS